MMCFASKHQISPQDNVGDTERHLRRDARGGSHPPPHLSPAPDPGIPAPTASPATSASRASPPRPGMRSDGSRLHSRSSCERLSPGRICGESPGGCPPSAPVSPNRWKTNKRKNNLQVKKKKKKNPDELTEVEGGDLRRGDACEASPQREMRRGLCPARDAPGQRGWEGTEHRPQNPPWHRCASLPCPPPAAPRFPETPRGI